MGLFDDAFGSYAGGGNSNSGILSFYDQLMRDLQPYTIGPGGPAGLPAPANAMGAATYPRIGYTPTQDQVPAPAAPVQPVASASTPADTSSGLPGLGGIGDRLGAGFLGVANAGSPMEALGNLFQGLFTGRRADVRGMALQQQNDMFNYLVKGGVAPSQAAIIAQSPKAQELYIAQMIQPKVKFAQIGEGPLGDKQFGFVNETDQTVKGYNASGGSGSAIPRDAAGNPMQGQDLLNYYEKAEPEAASMIKAIIRGDAGVTGRNLQKYMPIATLVDPTLSQFNYDARKKAALEFAPGGKSANNVKSLETVGGHIDKMMSTFDNLGNTWSPDYNTVKNWFAVKGGQGALNSYETAANGVANELGTVFRSYGMSDAEVKSWRDRISSANSPQQFNAAMGTLLDMLKTRKEALQEQYQQGLGKQMPPEQFQKLDAAIAKIQTRLSGTQQPTATPTIPTQPAALPPGSQYSPSRNQWRDPSGKLYDATGKPI